jgi:hypothetical protein
MQEFIQRLKELDRNRFEQFCFHLLKEQYPGTELHRVQGEGGDEGVDFFQGDLEIGSVVWQCKAFPNGIKKSQKDQIKASLKRALNSVHPVLWVLCLSVDLDIRAHRWWQRLQDSYRSQVKLELVSASELVHQLIFHRTLREAFFPHAIMDVTAVRTALAQTQQMTTEELANLSADNVAQYIDRLNERAPRFAYEVVFRGNTGPPATGLSRRPGLLLSVMDDQKTVNVFARDVESLRRDPPKVTFKLQGEGALRFQEFLEKGGPLKVAPGDLVGFSSDFDFLLPPGVNPVGTWQLNVQQSAEALPKYSFRVTFGRGADAVAHDFVRFETVRKGQKEVELRSLTNLPFAITIVLNNDDTSSGRVQFSAKFSGFSPDEVLHGAKAVLAATKGGECELYDLEARASFIRFSTLSEAPDWVKQIAEVADSAAEISRFYGLDLHWPATLKEEDLRSLEVLKNLIYGAHVSLLDVAAKLFKAAQGSEAIIKEQLAQSNFIFDAATSETLHVFGTTVSPAPLRYTVAGGRITNLSEYAAFLRDAPIGTTFTVRVQSTGGAILTALPRTPAPKETA